jgi:8-oxo-dGTP pyrophosphatase MutT (NUDIX family)
MVNLDCSDFGTEGGREVEMNSNESLIKAAVLVPIYRDTDNRLRVVFIRRAPGGVHGGELAFPGGKFEATDNSMRFTALRETHEEIGLAPESVRILTELPPITTKFSGFKIYPFLGAITPSNWVIDENEVAEVIDFDLESLTDSARYGEEVVHYDSWPEPRIIAFYRVGS